MFDVPVDSTYVWFGVGAVSLAVFGVAAGLPSAAPPDAAAAAATVDAVAVGPPGAVDHHELRADRIRLGSFQVGLDGPGGRAHAIFAYPVAPAVEDSRLERILAGERAPSVFGSAEEFTDAVATVQGGDPDWRPAPDRLTARRVAWRGVNVTLVG